MPENNQASEATKPEATDSSSTQPGSQAVDMNHTNAIVPHQISNHDKLVQTMVMVDGEWVNVNDTNDQKNVQEDMRKVNRVVTEAQKDIINAQNAADSAVKSAESAISASKVNSDAIVAQSEAISEAKSAMDSANADIQQTAANAASDAAKIRADVARVQNEVDTAKAANSASVEALKSDVSAAKQDLAGVHDSLTKAQSAIEQNQKLINDSVAKITSDVSATKQDLATVHDSLTKAQAAAEQNQKAINDSIAEINANVDATNQDLAGVRKDLTKAQSDITANQKAVNDNVAQINSDIEQDRKDIASAQQANADTVKQLDAYSKQAQEQGKTIKAVQDKQDGFSATLADVQGNVSQVSDKVSGLSASLKDAQDNVASVKAQADQLSATLTDHSKSIAILTASAKELSSTLEDADGRLSKVEQTAQTNSSTLSDVQGDLSQVKQNATTLTSTLKDAQGNISTLQQKADSVSAQLASAQGDIATLQTGIDGVKAILTSHDKSIHTLQADSKSLKDSMVNAQGDISTLRKTATDVTSELEDHTGRLSKVEQSAAKQATTLSDLQGNLTQVKQQADGLVTTLKDAQGSITQIQQKADGMLEQLKSAQGDIASLQTDVTGIKATIADHDKNIHNLQADSKTLKDDMADAQGNISSLKKSSTKLDSEMSSQDGRLSKVEQTAKEHTTTISDLGDKLNSMKIGGRNLATGTGQEYVMGYGIPNTTWQNGYAYEKLPATVTSGEILPQNDQFHANLVPGQEYTQTIWLETDAKVKKLEASITWFTHNEHDYQPAKIIKIGENSYKLFSTYTWPGKTDNNVRLFDIIFLDGAFDLATGTYLKFGKLKLETGNTSTDWTPAPEDLATVTQVKQTADGIETTLKSAQGDIDQIKQTAKGTSEQLADVQGNVTNIQKDVSGLKQTTADNAGNIHTLQSDSKSLHDSMQDAQGDISTLKKTSTDVTSELKDHAGRISKTEQTASTLVNELADQQGHLNRVEQTAQGTQQTVANQQGQINNIKTDAAGIHQALTGQGNQIANINVTLSGLNTKYEGVSGDLNNLKSQAQWATVTSAVDLNNVKTPCHKFLKGTVTNAPNEVTWWYLTVEGSDSGRITQTVIADQSNNRYTRRFADSWSAWVRDATQTDITALSGRITTNSTQITQNKQAIALKADQSSVNNLTGEVSQTQAQLKVQAGQISSKVSSEDFSALNDRAMQNRGTVNGPDFNTLMQAGYYTVTNTSGGKNYPTGNWGTLEVSGQTSDSNGRLNQKYVSDNNVETYVRQYNANTKSWTAWIKTVNRNDINTLDGKISKNSTAIDQTNKQISLKADQTEVDTIKGTASQNSSRLNTMANEIQSKVTSTDVNNIVDSKGYATTSTVQSLITQKADTINESITDLSRTVNGNNATVMDKIQSITASVDGVQSTVVNKADKSTVTQLANALQIKMTGSTIAQAKDVTLKYTGKDNEYPSVAPLIGLSDVEKGTQVELNFDYTASADVKFIPQFDGAPWIPWGGFIDNGVNAKKGVKGHYSKVITVGDDSWQKGTAANLAIMCDKYTGTIKVENLLLKKADTKHDVQSTVDMLRDDINLRVTKGDLLSQINLEAGRMLIQSNKIYLDADSVVFGKNSKAFIPAALITNLTADQITTGTLDAAKFNVKNFSADSITSGTLDGIKFKTEFTNDGGISIMGDRIAWTSMTSFGEQLNGWIENSTKEINWLSSRDLRLQSVSDVAVDTKGTDDVTRWSIADYDHYDQPGLMSSNTHKFIPEEHRLDESADADQSNAVLLASANTYVSVRRRTGVLAHLDSNDFNKDSIFAIQKDNKIGAYFGSGDNGNEVSITTFGDNNHITFNTGYFDVSGEVHVPDNGLTVKDLHVTHWLGVDGSKNSIVNTSQGTVAINAYETAEYYFGDIGEDQTNGDGKIWVSIDYLFGQTVNTSVPYQVFVTPYSSAHVWVSKRLKNRFLVESDKPSASFAWEIKAKRKGYEHTRLKNVDNMIEKPAGVK